jgi:hypothetical protein
MDTIKDIARQYIDAGKKLTLLGYPRTEEAKVPFHKDWRNRKIKKSVILNSGRNLGWVIGDNDIVIDVDPKNGGDKTFEKLQKDLGIDLFPTVKTPSGGFHIYLKFKREEGFVYRKTMRQYPGIDFLTKGSQCVIPGSEVAEKGFYIFEDEFKPYFHQEECPEEIINLIKKREIDEPTAEEKADLGDFAGLIDEDAIWTLEKVAETLSKIDPNCDYDTWYKVGMGVHSAFPGKEGLDLYIEWSKGGDTFKDGECESKWRSFSKDTSGVTMGTVVFFAKENELDKMDEVVENFQQQIEIADHRTIKRDIYKEMKEYVFDAYQTGLLVECLKNRYKALGSKIPIAELRKNVSAVNVEKKDDEIPDWCKNWIYVQSHAAYFNLQRFKLVKPDGFNIENGSKVPTAPGADLPIPAHRYVSAKGLIRTVDTMAYLPQHKPGINYIDGEEVLNIFDHESVPIPADEYTPEGKEAIKRIINHIGFLCNGDEKKAKIIMEYIAHQRQFPGKKLLWAVMFISIEGLGKSFFAELARTLIGAKNVGVINSSQLMSNFNSFSSGTALNVIEELKIAGHNRYEVLNAIKPLITDNIIQINEKGVKQYLVRNVTNYIACSNFKDAIPIDEHDRRWMINYVNLIKLDDIQKKVGEPSHVYFPALFDTLKNYPGEIVKFFDEMEISDEFLAMKKAPLTTDKELMISANMAAFDGWTEAKELMDEGGEYWNQNVICTVDFFRELQERHPHIEFKTTRKNLLLRRLGLDPLPNPVKIDGVSKRVAVRFFMTNAQVKMELKTGGAYLEE